MQGVRIRTAAVAIALTTLACVIAIAAREPIRGPAAQPTEPRQPQADVTVAPPPEFPVAGALPPEEFVVESNEKAATPVWVRWAVAGIAVAGIVAAGAMLVRELRARGGRRRGAGAERPTVPEATVAQPSAAGTAEDSEAARRAVDAALESLREEGDPRAAVIEAYARMERVLAQRELGRLAPEAPREYLERVLREHDMPVGSLTALTDLFEEARFSLHPIPRSAPRRARSELETVRRALTRRE